MLEYIQARGLNSSKMITPGAEQFLGAVGYQILPRIPGCLHLLGLISSRSYVAVLSSSLHYFLTHPPCKEVTSYLSLSLSRLSPPKLVFTSVVSSPAPIALTATNAWAHIPSRGANAGGTVGQICSQHVSMNQKTTPALVLFIFFPLFFLAEHSQYT